MRRWTALGRRFFRRSHEDQDGMTLVEVMAAITIIAVAVLAIAATASTSLRSLRVARDRQIATQLASAAIETARAVSYETLAIATPCSSIEGDTYVSGSCPGLALADTSEPLVLSTSGDIDPYLNTDGRFTIRTLVSWFDDPSTASTRDAKRVTSVVTWETVGRATESVSQQATIVAEADRGLPVPEFVISPSTPQTTQVETGDPICKRHSLTNIGARDHYSITSDPLNGAGGNHLKSRDWRIYAWLGPAGDVPATDSEAFVAGSAPRALNTAYNGTLMVDGAGNPNSNGDLLPDSQGKVDRNETVSLVLCFEPQTSAVPDPTFDVTVRSGFDSNVNQTVTHTFDTVSLVLNLYLREPRSTGSTDPCGNDVWTRATETFVMTSADLAGGVPHCTTLRNYDTNHDSLPGLFLPRTVSGNPGPTASFEFQISAQSSSPVTLGGDASLRMWTSRPAALPNSTPNQARNVKLNIQLRRVNTENATRDTTFYSTTLLYSHGVAGWVGHDLTLPAVPSTDFTPEEYVALTVQCASDSQTDCALAYDVAPSATPPYDSNLVISAP